MPPTFKDYYTCLGVPKTATQKEIKGAFRKLARKHHPDVNANDPTAVEKFKEINEANEVLSDPEKRKKYDQLGPTWNDFGGLGGGRPGFNPMGGTPQYRTVDPAELEDLFGTDSPFSDFFYSMFGSGSAPGAGRTRVAAPRRGADIEGEATISFTEAAAGTGRTVELGSAANSKRVEVQIPAGIPDDTRIRVAGKGAAGSGGAPSGDLLIRVRVQADPRFTRDGDDVSVKVHVPLATALLGGSIEVPTPRGSRVMLTIAPETQNGARLRLRGQGMPRWKGSGNGDLYAEVNVRLPLPMTDTQKESAKGFL